ncbi:hypothetical protein [Fusibacter sp. JL216-2]|uniref:hypothetical protein n=1 Tax=Fusibacter sp. JL216-2 TaxID=3071453 RepID=UPI003D342B6B
MIPNHLNRNLSLSHVEGFLDLVNIDQTRVDALNQDNLEGATNKYSHKKICKIRKNFLKKSIEELYVTVDRQINKADDLQREQLLNQVMNQSFCEKILEDVDGGIEAISNKHIFMCVLLIFVFLSMLGMEIYLNLETKHGLIFLNQFYIGLCILDLLNYKRCKKKLENIVDMILSSDTNHRQNCLDILKDLRKNSRYYGKLELDVISLLIIVIDMVYRIYYLNIS